MAGNYIQRYDALVVREDGDKSWWTKIGAAFEKEGGTITVLLDAHPIGNQIILKVPEDRREGERGQYRGQDQRGGGGGGRGGYGGGGQRGGGGGRGGYGGGGGQRGGGQQRQGGGGGNRDRYRQGNPSRVDDADFGAPPPDDAYDQGEGGGGGGAPDDDNPF